jgi:hypothetical protein
MWKRCRQAEWVYHFGSGHSRRAQSSKKRLVPAEDLFDLMYKATAGGTRTVFRLRMA